MPDTAVRGLLEALPYVKAWANQVVVVKLGGAAMAAADLTDAVTEDLVLLHAVGVRVVLVHGGGSAVSEVGKRLGLQPRFVDGLRVTDDDTMKVAQMVQVGGISRDLVSGIARRGGQALALSGADGGGLLRAAPRKHTSLDSGEEVDLGRVGDIIHVEADLLRRVVTGGFIPVVAPIAVDDAHNPLNVNADEVARAVAVAMGAGKLIFLSDVPGVLGPDKKVLTRISAEDLSTCIEDGVITGGMIPKAEACIAALDGGVSSVTIADGRVPHAVLIELLTEDGVGTMIGTSPAIQTRLANTTSWSGSNLSERPEDEES
ncbi:MAG: acetylglutamate kinase [Deltaproteobacteria bacterium]|nr:acetylglutamate kinase [Deltaproteobacteria bacterium]